MAADPRSNASCPNDATGSLSTPRQAGAHGDPVPKRQAPATREPDHARVRAVLVLFDRHYSDVFRFARRSVDESTAEDVSQEVFARLMRLEGIEQREISGSYLLKIASNLIKRRYQRERRFGEIASRAAGRHAGAASTERVASGSVERADRDEATQALSSLSARERDAVDLIVCRGLSYREAAESMGAKVSDVNNWRYRGVERLRRDGSGGGR